MYFLLSFPMSFFSIIVSKVICNLRAYGELCPLWTHSSKGVCHFSSSSAVSCHSQFLPVSKRADS